MAEGIELLGTETGTGPTVAESERPGAVHEYEGSTESVEHDAQRAKRLRELRGHFLSSRRDASALLTKSAARLQHVIVLLLRTLVQARLAIDPSIVLLLLEPASDDEQRELDVDELLLEQLGEDPLAEDRDERRRRLAADRSALYRRNKVRDGAERIALRDFRLARQGGSVTLDRHAPSRSERDDQRDGVTPERDARRAHGGAHAGSTASFCETSSPSETSSLDLVSSAPTSSPSSPLDPIDHLPGDHSRARACEPHSAPPPLEDTSRRTDRGAWALVDACAKVHRAETGELPAFDQRAHESPRKKAGSRTHVYDGCLRALTRAQELAPELPMRERFELCRRAYASHVRARLPWKAWPDNARQYVRLANDARLQELESDRKAAAVADKASTRQRGDKEPARLADVRPIFERAAAGGASR